MPAIKKSKSKESRETGKKVMGLNPRGRGRGHGNKTNFQAKGRWGSGMMGQRLMFRANPPGMFGPHVGFPPEAYFGAPPFFGEPSGLYHGSARPSYGKFARRNFKRKMVQKSVDSPALEIDLTKPWVTEEIKNEDHRKQELLQTWRKTKTDEDWNKYKAQKLIVQSLFDKAKTEYTANHPEAGVHLENISTKKHYYCEMCDKSFRIDDDLLLHEAEHETCGRDGCEFTAHPKIIAKHIQMQHKTGLYKRIGKLYTEEDIAKWIEERKKHYPTRKVVEEKKILEQEKLNRGERIKDKEPKFNRSFNNKSACLGKKKNFEKKSRRNTKNRRTKKRKKTSTVLKSLEDEEISNFRIGVPAFAGIKNSDESEVPKKKDFDISDEEWETESKLQNSTKPLMNSSLRLLAAFYDSEEETQNEESNKEVKPDMSADEAPEEIKTIVCKRPLAEEESYEKNIGLKRKFMGKKYNEEKKVKHSYNDITAEKRSLTLLEKLLKKEIRHERNVILQCIHYVIQNNFFKK